MLKLYWITTLRNLQRNPFYTSVNLLGLVIGLSTCLLVSLYIWHELQFDAHEPNKGKLARVIMEYSFEGGGGNAGPYTSAKVMPDFKRRFPEIADGIRLATEAPVLKAGSRMFRENDFLYADPNFFQIFKGFTMLEGDPESCLKDKSSLVVTETLARKLFGTTQVMGKTVLLGSKQIPMLITGIASDPGNQTQIPFQALGSFPGLEIQEDTWWNANYFTYFQLQDLSQIPQLEAKINRFMTAEMKKEAGARINYSLEPFEKVRLGSPHGGLIAAGNPDYLKSMGLVALLMLTIACFTYLNLSTARALERAREVGVRKVSGARSVQVFSQFFLESFILIGFAWVLSMGICHLLLPWFSELLNAKISAAGLYQPGFLITSICLILLLALAAGTYPAFMLSRFNPVIVLKGRFKNTGQGLMMRKSLIVVQFGISVFLISGTWVVHRQWQFIRDKKMGYNREQVLILQMDQILNKKWDVLKHDLGEIPEVRVVSASFSPIRNESGYGLSKEANESKVLSVSANSIDEQFLEATGIQLCAGENISQEDNLRATEGPDSLREFRFILNETCCREMGWSPEEAIGKKVYLGSDRPGLVKGVVKDFHFASIREKIRPFVLFTENWAFHLLVKINTRDMPATLRDIEKKWKELAPHQPFEYRFMDEQFDLMYAAEKRLQTSFFVFAGMALLLACLGLFGLAAYTSRQRVKEIGIRKVLGAETVELLLLLVRPFLLLVGLGGILFLPLSWWAFGKWLEQFAYRREPELLGFGMAFGLLVLVALLTVAIQTYRSTRANPVTSLRTE
jgi:putative ABC transport system permease protein